MATPVMQSDQPRRDDLTKKWAVNSLVTPDLKILKSNSPFTSDQIKGNE